MITFQTEPYTNKQILNELNPLVRDWFLNKFKDFSPPQRFSILNIRRRENTLISSPTGSGKTLSAFLAIINELYGLSEAKLLEDRVYCVYISPLKALSNDIQRNLNEPLAEIETMKGSKLGIRVAVRTGDTTSSERSKMLRKPPHILITTPESLAIMLTTKKFRDNLRKVEWVIVDEIHAVASSKRGVHLSLSLERLQNLCNFTRIGLSATVSPLEEVAKYLVGMEEENNFRPCKIVDVQWIKQLDLKVLSPVENIIGTSFNESQNAMYSLIDSLIQSHKTTLIFTNTRSATERVVHHLKERFPKNYSVLSEEEGVDVKSLIGAHHGSLSKEHRLNIENRLKKGELKAVVCSTSLELGIDIGYIDLVILLGSPKSVARALQRIGRSGHKLHDQAKGRIIVLDRDDLVEDAVLLKAALEKKIDNIDIPSNCLDVLAQQVFGYALEDKVHIDTVFKSVKRSYCYRNLEWKDFFEIIRYLSGEFVSLEDRHVYAKIWHDPDTGMLGRRGKLSRVLFMTNVGTIPDETDVRVKLGQQVIGSIAEAFLERLTRGDVFVLGGETYEFQYCQSMTAFVKTSAGRPPTVPSWFSEMLPLSFDLAMEIQKFRRFMEEHLKTATKKEIMKFIDDYLYVDKYGANSIYEYFKEQFSYVEIPHDKKIIIEHYNDNRRKYVIFHTLYGRRVNDVLSRCVAYALSKIHNMSVEIGINDNGFYVGSNKDVQALRAFKLLKSQDLRRISELSLEKTEVLARRFRHCASRSLMILRSYRGRKKSVGRQQMSSRLLISAVRRISPDFPILKEARREVLEDLMDIKNAVKIMQGVENGSIAVKEIFTDVPSPFAFNLILMGYSDIMKMDDKMEFLKRMHDMVNAKISLKKGKAKIKEEELDYEKIWQKEEENKDN